MNQNPNGTEKRLWPGARAATRRLLLITLVLFPLEWVIFALLVKSWSLEITAGTAESLRHLVEGAVTLVVAISVTFLASLLPTFNRLFNYLFSARVVRRLLTTLAWLATIVALFYAEEDWRGWHAWNKYRRELEAGGAQLDLKAFTPPPVPDEQNFAATPFIKAWFPKGPAGGTDKQWGDIYSQASRWEVGTPRTNSNTPWNRRFSNLVAWRMAFDAIRSGHTNSDRTYQSDKLDLESRAEAAPAVLEGLKSCDVVLAELRAASQRPCSRYPVVYDLENPWGILLPHLSGIKAAEQRLQLKACAELAVGHSDKALEDVKLTLCLADSLKDEPFLISYLVRRACLQIAIQPVWEGLAEHAWTDPQLYELQSCFQQYNFVKDMKSPFDSERAAGILTADLLARGKYRPKDLTGNKQSDDGSSPFDSPAVDLFGRIAPRGWYQLEQSSYCKLFQVQLDGAFDPAGKRVFPRQLESNSRALDQALAGRNPFTTICLRHQFLAVVMLPSLAKIPMRAAMAQTAADQSALACALERYRLANGQFPDGLEMLVPRFISALPHDVITGESYKYHRTNDGQFVLYSVGWNEKDDGGVPGKAEFDDKEGDWVWQYLAK